MLMTTLLNEKQLRKRSKQRQNCKRCKGGNMRDIMFKTYVLGVQAVVEEEEVVVEEVEAEVVVDKV